MSLGRLKQIVRFEEGKHGRNSMRPFMKGQGGEQEK